MSRVDRIDTKALTRFLYAKPGAKLAFWGDIHEDIKQLIMDGFKKVDVNSFKLSGFVIISKGMIELGPEWLATYVTRCFEEIMSQSLELAIVAGEGPGSQQPIGMLKSLKGVVDGVYPNKSAIPLTDFSAISMAGLRAGLASNKTDNGTVEILINPLTYWLKVVPSLSEKVDGKWQLLGLPAGENIIQSHAVPQNKIIYGVLKNYFLSVSGEIKVDRYEQTLAIEDLDLYIAKFFGSGIPKDPNAFYVADLSEVEGATLAHPDTPENTQG